jgi:sn1-specific diacylglycerol lipase
VLTRQVHTRRGVRAATPSCAQSRRRRYAHGAMLACAKAIMADINEHGILEAMMMSVPALLSSSPSQADGAHGPALVLTADGALTTSGRAGSARDVRPDAASADGGTWPLVVVGHSLGAGVAALLALHLRTRYSGRVQCWAFAPPGGLLSPAAANSLQDICTSLVYAKVG